MKPKSIRSIYLFCIIAGGVIGLVFPICFSSIFIFGEPISKELTLFFGYVSAPVWYLLGEILNTNCIPFGILLLFAYWAILGMGLSFLLVWLFSLILRLSGRLITMGKDQSRTTRRTTRGQPSK